MPFWTYMIHCRDRTFYVGHTDDLDVRLAQHNNGTLGGYTARKRPVMLVWSAEFPTRYEAIGAERRIKGWSRAKKMALIRGDWDGISRLARSKGRPSTGSGRTDFRLTDEDRASVQLQHPTTVRPELVEGRSYFLLRHSQSSSDGVGNIQVLLQRTAHDLHLRFTLSGEMSLLAVPEKASSDRADGLWQHTCFEAFIHFPGGDYWEFNFSPSTQWAAYGFTAYREGMAPLAVEPSCIHSDVRADALNVHVTLPLPLDLPNAALGLSAVIEATDGAKSYWALAHPPGPPDFHDPACFTLQLPPAPQP